MVYYYSVDTGDYKGVLYHATDTATGTNLIRPLKYNKVTLIVIDRIKLGIYFNDKRVLIDTYADANTFYQDHPEYYL